VYNQTKLTEVEFLDELKKEENAGPKEDKKEVDFDKEYFLHEKKGKPIEKPKTKMTKAEK